jgi:quinol-cytochrome oxidoreductase complex cytochrome b subunit
MTSLSGWLALLYLGVSAISGMLLAWHYQPSDLGAFASVVSLEQIVRGGRLLRSLHFFSTQLALGLTLGHFVAVLVALRAGGSAGAAERPAVEERPRPGVGFTSGLLALVLVALSAFSGRVLPWDQHGGLSLTMFGELFRIGGHDPLRALLGEGGLRVQRVFLLHLLGSALLAIALVVHLRVPARARLRSWLAGGRRWIGATLAALGAVGLAALWPAPLGEPFALGALSSETVISAEWYLRWLQYLSIRSSPLARAVVLVALALVLAAPLYGRRLGPRGLRALWGGVLLLGLLTSLLPARP